MKVVTIIGTRPEIIRTSQIVGKLDKYCDHTIVHTSQNFQANLKDLFYQELGLRQPDIVLNSSMTSTLSHTGFGLGTQLADMFPQIEQVFKDAKPDKVFILGDTNSALCTIIAERMGIPVYHMEAANRSFNRAIPEEVNRVLIDSIASYNLFYTPTNRHTLLKEGHDPKRIFQCGNPTKEVLKFYKDRIDKSTIFEQLGLAPWDGGAMAVYFLADIHRAENINNPDRMMNILHGLNLVACHYNCQVIVSIHPSTKAKLPLILIFTDTGHERYINELGDHFEYFGMDSRVKFMDACGFFDFVKLEKSARVGLTDSGLCSEEYCLLGVPCVIVRNETERPEVVEAGGAMISGTNAEDILKAVQIMDGRSGWTIPDGYQDTNVSDRVVNYILGKAQ
jgi:UDP-N-acetylglucosamine 2-epimerase (non-hydrolysing)